MSLTIDFNSALTWTEATQRETLGTAEAEASRKLSV